MVSHFRPLLLPARARGSYFLLPLWSLILQLGVPLATEKGSRWAVAAVSFVARSSPEPGRFAFPAPAVCRRSIGLVAVDLAIAAADPVDPAVAADPASGLAV